MTEKQRAYLHLIILPFVISAAFEFCPPWVYWPICLLGCIAWVGSCVILSEKDTVSNAAINEALAQEKNNG